MISKMMRIGAVLGVALAVSACFAFNDVGSSYEADVVIHYEPDYESQYQDFLSQFFNGGRDSVAVNEFFTIGPATHCAKLDADKNLTGGFALCVGIDTISTPDRRPARFAVFDKGGWNESLAYAVFHDTLSTFMPEKCIELYVANDESSNTLRLVYVQNVQAVVQAVKHGIGLAGGPFTAEDYLTLTFTGKKKGTATGSKSVKLVDGTKLLEKWTEVDLSSLGSVDELDLHLESSRPDCPLYCCIDNLYFHYEENY